MDEKKTFFNVIGLSEKFREFDGGIKEILAMPLDDKATGAEKRSYIHVSLLVWQVRAQMATAQQLTVIAQELKVMNERLSGGK